MILQHLLNVLLQIANKAGNKKKVYSATATHETKKIQPTNHKLNRCMVAAYYQQKKNLQHLQNKMLNSSYLKSTTCILEDGQLGQKTKTKSQISL
jgi:hypothetical protein